MAFRAGHRRGDLVGIFRLDPEFCFAGINFNSRRLDVVVAECSAPQKHVWRRQHHCARADRGQAPTRGAAKPNHIRCCRSCSDTATDAEASAGNKRARAVRPTVAAANSVAA